MCTIYVAEQHDQIFHLWREQKVASLRILHLDFHCDMRGLLIDRKAQKAYRIWDPIPDVEQGNFMTHAILEGLVKSVRWVHDEPGGRQYDVGTVKYESDLTALLFRLIGALRGRQGVPVNYSVVTYTDWRGLNEGECLDIDWDFFACKEYPVNTIQDRIDSFLARDIGAIPREVYVCYSPDYSHPTRHQFKRFISDLAQTFNAKVVKLEPAPDMPIAKSLYKKYVPSPILRVAKRIYCSVNLGLRKRGIY